MTAEAFEDKDHFDPATSRRIFRVRVVSLQAATLMPELVRRVQEEAPHVQFEVTVRGTFEVSPALLVNAIGYLDRHEFDIVIGPFTGHMQKWHRKIDYSAVPMMCLYDGPRLGLSNPIALEQYLSMPHVVPYFAAHAKTIIDAGLEAIGHARHFKVLTDDHSSIPFYLKRTDAIANFPLHAAQMFAENCGLTMSPLPFDTAAYEQAIFWHAKDDVDPGHRWLRSLVASVSDDLRGS